MEKEIFEKAFITELDKNFEKYAKYFEFEFHTYPELGTTIFEINKCLILEFYKASITLTNNLLERVLKLALIYNDTGLGPEPVEKWYELFSGPHQKFGSISLGSSIDQCKKVNLITDDEKNILYDTIRESIRNGFSHADSSKVLKDLPDEATFYQADLNNLTELKPITLNQKVVPVFQSINIDNFAKANAHIYFDFVFRLMKSVDEKLKAKFL